MTFTPRPAATESAPVPGINFFDFGASNAALESWFQVQQRQWDALLNWQRSLADVQQDLWDQWVCHWAGGVPIDA